MFTCGNSSHLICGSAFRCIRCQRQGAPRCLHAKTRPGTVKVSTKCPPWCLPYPSGQLGPCLWELWVLRFESCHFHFQGSLGSLRVHPTRCHLSDTTWVSPVTCRSAWIYHACVRVLQINSEILADFKGRCRGTGDQTKWSKQRPHSAHSSTVPNMSLLGHAQRDTSCEHCSCISLWDVPQGQLQNQHNTQQYTTVRQQ